MGKKNETLPMANFGTLMIDKEVNNVHQINKDNATPANHGRVQTLPDVHALRISSKEGSSYS